MATKRSARRRQKHYGEERFAGQRSAKLVLRRKDARSMHAARSADEFVEGPRFS
jgi:hypothetical protein